MSQDTAFTFNNNQGATVQDITIPPVTTPVPNTPLPSAPVGSNQPVISSVMAPPPPPQTIMTGTNQGLPSISTFDSFDPSSKIPVDVPATVVSEPQNTVEPETTVLPSSNQSMTSPVNIPILNAVPTVPTTPTQPTSDTNTTATATPDFRALAEEIVSHTPEPPNIQTQDSSIPPEINALPQTPLASPATTPVVDPPTQTPPPLPSTAPEPQLEADPFIQEVHEQDVKVERDALETLISSSRIDPELKEHLKIELLKFKEIENDTIPLGQDINTIAAEVMAPEASVESQTPNTNPIQTLPPEIPM